MGLTDIYVHTHITFHKTSFQCAYMKSTVHIVIFIATNTG